MKRIRVYGTSANLGPGFDCLGIALDVFNEYKFKRNKNFQLVNFEDKFSYYKSNLIVASYLNVFDYLAIKPIPLYLEQIATNVPTSRGLGSSAACIVAGLKIANDMLDNKLSDYELLKIATEIEGHPDNVAPALFGGLIISSRNDEEIYYKKISVSKDLKFLICIPPFELSTREARSVLHKKVDLNDAIFNISHALLLLKGLEEGNMKLINEGIEDKLHVQYRINLIKHGKELIDETYRLGAACTISGAGSSMIIISKNSVIDDIKKVLPHDWKLKELNSIEGGPEINEE